MWRLVRPALGVVVSYLTSPIFFAVLWAALTTAVPTCVTNFFSPSPRLRNEGTSSARAGRTTSSDRARLATAARRQVFGSVFTGILLSSTKGLVRGFPVGEHGHCIGSPGRLPKESQVASPLLLPPTGDRVAHDLALVEPPRAPPPLPGPARAGRRPAPGGR